MALESGTQSSRPEALGEHDLGAGIEGLLEGSRCSCHPQFTEGTLRLRAPCSGHPGFEPGEVDTKVLASSCLFCP